MRLIIFMLVACWCAHTSTFSQSIHQLELEYYNSQGLDSSAANDTVVPNKKPGEKTVCSLNKMVYGWHPYWIGSEYQNYQWDLLSHLSFFSYEVDYLTGNAVSTHGWSTNAAVNTALATGTTKVTLCVTLFANHTSFLGNATAKQTLITNLINLISSRGAHGINIDFEGLPSSQGTAFANFMVDLANQMHAAIPGSEVSTVLYSVDWNSVFNFSIMEPEVDYYIIMGYDYYYSGSTTAGPNDPLYQFGTSYNYTLSRSLTDYIKAGCPKNKLILGLPYYGREWSTSSLTVPSTTTASGVTRTYSTIQANSSGFYSSANHSWDSDSQTDRYLFMNGTTPKQCFVTEETAFAKRLQHVLNAGIGGIGIWALGYDNGYSAMWDAIRARMTNCYTDSCTAQIHDFGGPTKNYYNNENYTWTIQPPNATSLTVSFTQFDVEANYDTLFIYDGNSVSTPLIGNYTGTNSPGNFTTSGGAVTFRFKSDGSTTKPGFLANYVCNVDNQVPSTLVQVTGNWQTQDFTASYQDSDNGSVADRFSLITDSDGATRSANRNLGYLYDDFSGSLSQQWTYGAGVWSVNSGLLNQAADTSYNTALNATLTQDATSVFLYHWKGKMGGTAGNRRSGLHFFCSDPTLPNRGNSYLVYWRVDSDKCQIYRCANDVITLETDNVVVIDPDIEYDFKVMYNPQTGEVRAYLNDILSSVWTDPSPLTTGNSVSFRTGNCTFSSDELQVFKSRQASQLITIGSPTTMVRVENSNPVTPSCRISSIVRDDADLFSTINLVDANIDWTVPVSVTVSDGNASDIDVFVTPTQLSANWSASNDPNSAVDHYELAIGTTPGGTDVSAFQSVGNILSTTLNGLSLNYGTTYYASVKVTNGAGLTTTIFTSDGQLLQVPTAPPIANFTLANSVVCEGDSIQMINSSTDATSWQWKDGSGVWSTFQDPYYVPASSGTYSLTLIASNSAGSDTLTQSFSITVQPGPVAYATPDQVQLTLPNAIVLFTNTSQNSDNYFWDFGDGETSVNSDPWHQYANTGVYNVMLVAFRDGCISDTTYFTITVGQASLSELQSSQIKVSPNPVGSEFTVYGKRISHCELYDARGRKVWEGDGKNEDELKIRDFQLNSGMYLLKVKHSSGTSTVRIVRE